MKYIMTLLILLTLTALPAAAGIIVAGSSSAYLPVKGAELSDVRLAVDLSVDATGATMTLTNASIAPESSAVFKELVIDMYDDTTHTAIFSNPRILDASPGVSFDFDKFNGLPGYTNVLKNDEGMLCLQAASPTTKAGLGIGSRLRLRFDTVMSIGSTIETYFAQFRGPGDGEDTAIGFHAISASIINGQSLSGMDMIYTQPPPVPEPATLAVLAVGGAMLFARRRRTHRML